MGIVHGDLQPGNLLFSLSSRGVKSLSGRDLSHDARLLQGTGPEDISEPVRRFDGKQDLWAPKYLSLNKPLAEFSEITSDFTLKLSDLGGELIVGGKVTTSQDIWSFGCLVFEFLTGTPLFAIWKSPWCDEHEADDDHLLQLSEILGPLPSFLLSRWARSNIYFNANGENIKNYIGVLPEGYSENDDRFTFLNLEDSFGEGKPAHIRPEEQKEIIALLRYILQYDQKLRPSAAELLRHPWFERQQDE
ncbi:MAG: hypothetical protein M1815_005130 [Lichina confinis]|nr:MAG: hypothetical protein M1815_005130 [Lichina confinis]